LLISDGISTHSASARASRSTALRASKLIEVWKFAQMGFGLVGGEGLHGADPVRITPGSHANRSVRAIHPRTVSFENAAVSRSSDGSPAGKLSRH
jgi:hypothetical protein